MPVQFVEMQHLTAGRQAWFYFYFFFVFFFLSFFFWRVEVTRVFLAVTFVQITLSLKVEIVGPKRHKQRYRLCCRAGAGAC